MRYFRMALVFLQLASLSLEAAGQTITGKVVDQDDNSLAYANVIMQRADSTFIAGTMTDTCGVFVLKEEPEAVRIQISFISYKNSYVQLTGCDCGTIRMTPDTEMLGKSVVKAVIPKTEIIGDAFVTKIENSLLADAGSANDVLNRLPGVIRKDGKLEVFGKGVPIIYINGRLVRDDSELELLNSNEIKSVDVIHNPGARYDATVKAVIRIKTIKRSGEGFGFDLRSSLMLSENIDLLETINMNYRHNSLDVFGSLSYAKTESYQELDVVQRLQSKHPLELKQTGRFDNSNHGLTPTLGMNYQFNENHSAGVRYRPYIDLRTQSRGNSFTEAFINGKLDDRTNTLSDHNADNKASHQANLYYNGTVGGLTIDFNADIMTSGGDSESIYNEHSELGEDRIVNTMNHTRNHLYASKLTLSWPLLGGMMTAGSEYTYTHRDDNYQNAENYIPSTFTTIKEDNTNAFLEYVYPFKFGSLSAGIRYEHLAFNYFENDMLQKEQSRKFANFYPSASFAAVAGNVQMMLSYATKTTRPSYDLLSNSVTYIDRYSMTKGNPYLLPEINHEISFAAVWNYLQFAANYTITRRAHIHIGTEQEGIDGMILHTTNFDRNIPTLEAMISASPTISFWNPSITAGLMKQWLSVEYHGEERDMSKAIPFFAMNNTLVLPKNYMVSLDYTYIGEGCQRVYELVKATHDLGVAVRKSFLNDTLSIELKGTDLLKRQANSVKICSQMYDIYQKNNFDSRQIILTVRYKFNSTNSKYKGTGAGEQQKSRL